MSGAALVIPKRGDAVSAPEMVDLERRITTEVPAVKDVETLEEWRRRLAALESYLRDKELQKPALGAQRRIEARIGELLPKELRGRPKSGHDRAFTQVHEDDRADFRVLARAFNGCSLTEDEWRKSRRALVHLIRQMDGDLPKPPPLPEGTFRCVVADPPWRLDTGPDAFNTTGEAGHDALAYEQMSVEEIKALPIADRVADDAHLYLWTTNRYVEHAYSVARAWGFKPSVLLVWAKKPRGVGLGDAFKLTTEFVLYARRGKLRESKVTATTWFSWPRGSHSTKPADFYKLVEATTPAADGDRLELFARKSRKGWVAWGDEVPR